MVERHDAWGVGTLLNGDGLVAVDIDNCVRNGVPNTASIEVMRLLGIGYVEFSPSGTGLHGYALGKLPVGCKSRKKIYGIEVEIYSNARFITVTGRALWSQGVQSLNESPLLETEEKEESEDREVKDDSEDTDINRPSASSVKLLINGCEYELPNKAQPKGVGERNRDLFELARFVKGKHAELGKAARRICVQQWHDRFLSVIGTKEFDETVADFENAWRKVKFPAGQQLDLALERIDGYAAPQSVVELGTVAAKIFRLCLALSDLQKPGPFFVASGKVAELFGCSRATVCRRLDDFLHLELIYIHEASTSTRARRFMLKK